MPDDLIIELSVIEQTTAAREEENLAFRQFVKADLEHSDRQLNAIVQQMTQ